MKNILVISTDHDAFRVLRSCYRSGYRIERAPDQGQALKLLSKRRYDFLFIDLDILRAATGGNCYKSALQVFWKLFPTIETIVMAHPNMIRECVMAVKAGASNYLTYPLNPDEVKYVIESVYESLIMQSELDYLRDQFWQADALELVQTRNPAMKKVFDKVRSVAPTKSTVILVGETGTGKGVMANLIHMHSNRRDAPFISVHCGAMPDTLLESELFGHEKGAFTGAVKRKLGKFEIAKGGTIFLDEIGTVTPSAQIKLLQVLQDRTFQRLGGEETIEADSRVIAATNADLKKMCEDGLFRKDLFYRLNVFPIDLPPLKDRAEDIPHFVDVFLKEMNQFYGKDIHDVDARVTEAFMNYSWPGNIRELDNLIERAYILESSSLLTPESFPSELFEFEARGPVPTSDESPTLAEARRRGLEVIEKAYLEEQLTKQHGKIQATATSSGITPRQLHKLMKKYNLRKETYKQ